VTIAGASGALRRALRRLGGSVGLGPDDARLEEELGFHLDALAADLERAGHAPAEARRLARLKLGLEPTKESWRDERGLPALDALRSDLRQAARRLRRDLAFTAAALVTLALGIGATAVVFSLVRGVLLRPLPYPDPAALVRVFESSARFPRFPVSPLNFLDYAAGTRTLEALGAYTRQDLELSGAGEPVRLRALLVSPGYFQVLGARPALGRFLDESEMREGARVVVISHALWRERLGSDPGVIGTPIRLERQPFTVVGVMEPGFEHVGGDYRSLPQGETVDAWWPLPLEPNERRRGWHYLNVVGRLRTGASAVEAEADLNRVAALLAARLPETNAGWRVRLRPLAEEMLGESRTLLFLLTGASGLVLLIACANVTSLLLARATARRREIGVRHALGASRGRLVAYGLAEAGLLVALGGGGGILLARGLLPGLLHLLPSDFPRLHAVRLDSGVLLFTLAVGALATLALGLLPAVQAGASDLRSALHEETRGGTAGARTLRWRRTIVVAEVTLACGLLVASGLLLRSFARLLDRDPGFRPEGAIAFELVLPEKRYPKPRDVAAFHERLEERLRALPGVAAAGATTALPWTGWDENTGFGIVGDSRTGADEPNARFGTAGPGFFAAAGVRLVRGRLFTSADGFDAPKVVIVNEALARAYFPGQDPVGRVLEIWDAKPRIVGVVADVRDAPADDAAHPAFFWPQSQAAFPATAVVVRGKPEEALLRAVPRVVASLDPELPVAGLRPLDEVAAVAHARRTLLLALVSCFAGLALLLAAVGSYGVLAYSVEQRRHEIGIRLALGASGRRVVGEILGESLRLAALGVGLGLAVATLIGRALSSQLFGISPRDPLALGASAVGLVAVTVLAAAHPAWRAVRTEPAKVLRAE
jgi:predicted permease